MLVYHIISFHSISYGIHVNMYTYIYVCIRSMIIVNTDIIIVSIINIITAPQTVAERLGLHPVEEGEEEPHSEDIYMYIYTYG